MCDAAEMFGASMLRLGKTGAVGAPAPPGPDRSQGIYQRHAAALYQQALLMLGDLALAEDVVRDVLVGECALVPARGHGEDETRYRLVQSVFRRCQRLAADPGRHDCWPPQWPSQSVAGSVDPGGILSEKERGALGLVLFGGLGYVQASAVLGISPRDAAALLRTVMGRLAISSAAAAAAAAGTSERRPEAGSQ
jgi:DNA-binding CsgD family transcriptional regulator